MNLHEQLMSLRGGYVTYISDTVSITGILYWDGFDFYVVIPHHEPHPDYAKVRLENVQISEVTPKFPISMILEKKGE